MKEKRYEFCVYVSFLDDDGRSILSKRIDSEIYYIYAKSLKDALYALYFKVCNQYVLNEKICIGINFFYCDDQIGDWYYFCRKCQNDDFLRERFWC